MGNVKKTYSDFHKAKQSGHVYPTEWVIRTILGKYPDLNLDKTKYKGAVLLDLEFGDCRNMPLLQNCEFDIYGVEISDEIVSMAENKISDLGISATLKKGTNSDIPFDTDFFSYLFQRMTLCFAFSKVKAFIKMFINLPSIKRCVFIIHSCQSLILPIIWL